MTKKITLEFLKRRKNGDMDRRIIDITTLDNFLSPEEIFFIEFKINEIMSLRAHISVIEDYAEPLVEGDEHGK